MYDMEIKRFFDAKHFAVAGASPDRSKFGNKVLRALASAGKDVVGIHPIASNVEGLPTFKTLADVPGPIESLSIVTSPSVTERIVTEAIQRGVCSIWMQPGAESEFAIEQAQQHGIDVIAGGPCLLVRLSRAEDD